MRHPRVALAALVLVLALAGVIAAALAGGGARGETGASSVAWKGPPQVVAAPGLPRDGIVTGQVRNETLRPMTLVAADLVVLDDRGRRWPSSGRFMTGFAHGLWPPGQQVAVGSDAERERIGEISTLEPGETAPLTVAWRRPRGGGRPLSIDLGGPTLAIPGEPKGL